VIVALDGVAVENDQSLTVSLKSKGAGATVRLRLVRADRERSVSVTLDARPEVYSLDEQAVALTGAGRYGEAMAVSEKALALGQLCFGADETIVAVLLLRIAEIHERQGRFAEAEPYYTRGLPVLEKVRAPTMFGWPGSSMSSPGSICVRSATTQPSHSTSVRSPSMRRRRAPTTRM
jgi:hypothetical protein